MFRMFGHGADRPVLDIHCPQQLWRPDIGNPMSAEVAAEFVVQWLRLVRIRLGAAPLQSKYCLSRAAVTLNTMMQIWLHLYISLGHLQL